jgi:prepilin peptidase CpaA
LALVQKLAAMPSLDSPRRLPTLHNVARHLLHDDDGQDVVEYGLLVATIGLVVLLIRSPDSGVVPAHRRPGDHYLTNLGPHRGSPTVTWRRHPALFKPPLTGRLFRARRLTRRHFTLPPTRHRERVTPFMPLTGSEITFAVAVIVAAVALATDLRHRRIPNWLTGGTVGIGLIANVYFGGLNGGLSSLAGAGLGLAILLPFYAMRTMGAGDVKLLAAFGALLGPQVLVSVAVYGSLVGGIQSLAILARHHRVGSTLYQLAMGIIPARSGATAPYAVALSSGVCLAMLLPPVLRF